jgi:hypothetical protein
MIVKGDFILLTYPVTSQNVPREAITQRSEEQLTLAGDIIEDVLCTAEKLMLVLIKRL